MGGEFKASLKEADDSKDVYVVMRCNACGQSPSPEYIAELVAHEADLRKRRGDGSPWFGGPSQLDAESGQRLPAVLFDGDGKLGNCHYAVFGYAWGCMRMGPEEIEDLQAYTAAIETLLRCLSRFYGTDCHPQLLSLCHTMSALTANSVDAQKKWLSLERAIVARFYPEECEKQDDEILRMCQGRGGPPIPFDDEQGAAQNGGAAPSEESAAADGPPLPPAVEDLRAGRWPRSLQQTQTSNSMHAFEPPPRVVEVTSAEEDSGVSAMDAMD